MKMISGLTCHALGVCATIVILAGCGDGDPVSPSPPRPSTALRMTAAERTRPGVTYGVLYSFGGDPDGADPYANLINVKGTLYGTTLDGGSYGRGTAFAITPSGAETVLHSFGASGDGTTPFASLTEVNGTFYGTTLFGEYGRGAE